MTSHDGIVRDDTHGGAGTTSELLHLRMVELFSFFIIVFATGRIAGFIYELGAFLFLFAAAIFLQFSSRALPGALGRTFGWSETTTDGVLLWYSTLLDFLAVFGIIYLTGSIESPFLFLLVIPLFFASHIFSLKVTVGPFLVGTIATVSTFGYLELIGVIPHVTCYPFENKVYLDRDYYMASLLVLGGFLSLIIFLSHAFQNHFQSSISMLRRRDKETKDTINELSKLYDISLGINTVMTVETLLKMVAKEATILLSQPWASIILFNQQQEITHSAIVGIPESFHSTLGSKMRKGGLTEWLWKNNRPVVVEDVLSDKRASTGEFLMATKIRSLIGLPLSTGHQVIGVIYIGDFVAKHFEPRHVRLLAIMSDQLAIAIAKSKLYESIQRKLQNYESKIESLERTNALKSEYVSHASHELRTPLTSIKAYMETLRNHIDDPTFTEKKDFVNIVSKETDRLIRVVNDILDVSNIEFGQRAPQREPFQIEDVITEVSSMMQPRLAEKNITLRIDLPGDLPKVDADKDLMTQVFINLITNAVKYSPEGTMVTVRAKEDAVDLVISVEDQGIGIPGTEVERIFDKYFRVKSEQSRQYDGIGLGLAIVKNIIEQHGGTIAVSSKENVGSKFTFTLPKEHCVNELLGYIAEGVDSESGLHEMLTVIVRMIAELLSAKIVSLMLLDQNRTELFIKVSYGLDGWIVDQARVRVGEGIAGKVAETGLPLLIDNIEENEFYNSPNNPQYETVSLLSVPLKIGEVIVGVINVNNKTSGRPFDQDDMNLLLSFAERIAKALERLRAAEKSTLYLADTVEAFKKMLDKQIRTKGIGKIVDLAVKVTRKLKLGVKEAKVVQYVASVHDIGMTQISDEILNKTFNLTTEELAQIRSHPQAGTELIRPLEFVELVSNIILHHHERVDGLGYPMGLKGDEIPFGSRILAVIDTYQSMTGERPYREQQTPVDAAGELVECAGKQFDTEVVACFIDVLRDERKLSDEQAKGFHKALEETASSTY
ncbi:MAG: HD domain-containing phosphohydrolase [Candidatus Krumholzibacteriia bacterium]